MREIDVSPNLNLGFDPGGPCQVRESLPKRRHTDTELAIPCGLCQSPTEFTKATEAIALL